MTTSPAMDRREFLVTAGVAAGAAVATTLVPLSVVHASTANVSVAAGGTVGTWHVDDVCGHWPPYSHPIGYGRARVSVTLAQSEPVDHIFLA